jgi:amino-acid N-acetyltransferase
MSDIVQNIDRFLVCKKDGELAGVVSWQILPEIGAPHEPSLEIKSLAVRNASQGLGIGQALVRAAVEHVRSLHPLQIIVLTFAPDFFGKLGFRKVPKETLMHKLYTGCINCSKYDSPMTCPEVAMVLDMAAA